MTEVKVTRVLKVIYHTLSGYLISASARGKTLVNYSTARWVSAPEWLKKEGYNLTCYPLSLEGLKAALLSMRYRGNELWLAEGRNFSNLPKCLDLRALASGQMVPSNQDWPPQTIMAEEIYLLRQVGVDSVRGFAVVRKENEYLVNAFSPESKYLSPSHPWGYLDAPRPHLQVMFSRLEDAKRASQNVKESFVIGVTGLGVITEPPSTWAPEFLPLVKAWPQGAVQAGWITCWEGF